MVDEKLNNYMYKFIEDICNDIGPRESGTEQEILAGNRIEEELKDFCDETRQEPYVSSPHAFLGGIRWGSMLVFVVIILYWLTLLIELNVLLVPEIFNLIFLLIAVLLIFITVSYFILEVMKYHEVFDFLFSKKESKNIIGTINPSGEIKNTIIFSGHHDSAFEFNSFYYLKRFGQIIINVGYIGVGIILLGLILRLFYYLLSIEFTMMFVIFGIIFLIFTPIIIVYMFFHSYNPVLGAFDNLSAVAVVLGIGKYLSENKNDREIYPEHTKIYLISFAGEEAGLRGSKRYVKAHYKELKESGTIVVNLESIAQKDVVIVHNKESGIGAKHDPGVYEKIFEIAKDLNFNPKILSLPFGATDAAVFSKKKIPATTIGGLNLKDELPPHYHTRKDTPDVIDKEALGQIFQVCIEYLKFIDKTA